MTKMKSVIEAISEPDAELMEVMITLRDILHKVQRILDLMCKINRRNMEQ
jgi:hypothetical protein